MNISHLGVLSFILISSISLTACSKVGDLVSNTGDFVSKTGEIISGKKEEPQAPIAIKEPTPTATPSPETPKKTKIKKAQIATAKVQVKTTSKLTQPRINITILQLKSNGKFSSSRLSELESDAESALGGDFINKQTLSLKRDSSKTLNFNIEPTTKTLAMFASFQELNQTIWRTSVQLPKATNKSYTIHINVDQKSISASKK